MVAICVYFLPFSPCTSMATNSRTIYLLRLAYNFLILVCLKCLIMNHKAFFLPIVMRSLFPLCLIACWLMYPTQGRGSCHAHPPIDVTFSNMNQSIVTNVHLCPWQLNNPTILKLTCCFIILLCKILFGLQFFIAVKITNNIILKLHIRRNGQSPKTNKCYYWIIS